MENVDLLAMQRLEPCVREDNRHRSDLSRLWKTSTCLPCNAWSHASERTTGIAAICHAYGKRRPACHATPGAMRQRGQPASQRSVTPMENVDLLAMQRLEPCVRE